MKKSILIVMFVLIVAGMVGTVAANGGCPEMPAGVPSTDLMAGQSLDIGDVYSWNDEGSLYVKYVITKSGWYFTETHLACGV